MKPDRLRVLGLAFLILYADAAAAQQGRERELTVTLFESQWNSIGKCLAKQPFEEVVLIMNELQRQTAAQIAANAGEVANMRAELERLRAENAKLKEGQQP
jgi:hypothetical protein